MLTHAQLCKAVEAMIIIEQYGNEEEFIEVLQIATKNAQSCDPWGNATPGQELIGGIIVNRLARLLNEVEKWEIEEAAAEVIAPQRLLSIYQAIIGYANELVTPPIRGNLEPVGATEPIVRRVPIERESK